MPNLIVFFASIILAYSVLNILNMVTHLEEVIRSGPQAVWKMMRLLGFPTVAMVTYSIGLLRGKEWARKVAIAAGIFCILNALYRLIFVPLHLVGMFGVFYHLVKIVFSTAMVAYLWPRQSLASSPQGNKTTTVSRALFYFVSFFPLFGLVIAGIKWKTDRPLAKNCLGIAVFSMVLYSLIQHLR